MSVRCLPVAALVAAGLSLLSPLAHAAAVPAGGELDFTVLRDGEEIGTHVMRFDVGSDGSVDVDIETDIEVSMMFVTVYRFEHEGHEHWENGRLFSLNSRTDDDGEDHDLVVTADASSIRVADNGQSAERQAGLLPASLWNDGIVAAPKTTLLNTLDGSAMDVTVTRVGDEEVEGVTGPVTATHYVLAGDLSRELWYDPQGVLVKVRFSAEDGSNIEYVLR